MAPGTRARDYPQARALIGRLPDLPANPAPHMPQRDEAAGEGKGRSDPRAPLQTAADGTLSFQVPLQDAQLGALVATIAVREGVAIASVMLPSSTAWSPAVAERLRQGLLACGLAVRQVERAL